MSTEVHDYISVSAKLAQWGINPPAGFAILPFNLAEARSTTELRQHAESETVKKLLRTNNIAYSEVFDADSQPAYLQQYGFEWFGPTLFFTAAALSQNPSVLSVSLGIVTNYLYDLFKGAKNGTASLDVIIEKADGSCKKVNYKGSPEGLASVADIVRELGGD
ncbi:hypothetical protein GCN78_16885 [Janthinobacterium rivuli]|uniref:hypothetical protein n=1 Tax=Janthinobacterium sp. FT68W TaxID=2654255 RepID=UPI001263F3B0|nr:hypothetical protein [Janthinobacterium sp. FT68W]KAB8049568.1 hypothetical protein GCN78_16885 [Janthinobacterium sp. FT68W]